MQFYKVCMGLLGEGICSTRTEAGLTWGCSMRKVGTECWCYTGSHKWLCVYDEGLEKTITPAISFALEDFHQQALRLVTKSPSHKPQQLSNYCFNAASLWAVFCAISLRTGTQLPVTIWSFSEPSLIIFKVPGFKSHS